MLYYFSSEFIIQLEHVYYRHKIIKEERGEELNWTLPVVFDKTDVMLTNIDTWDETLISNQWLPWFDSALDRARAMWDLGMVIPNAERLCRKRSCAFPGSGFKMTCWSGMIGRNGRHNQQSAMFWEWTDQINRMEAFERPSSEPETECGVEAY